MLCFNKEDIAGESRITELKEIYENCGCRVIFTSALKKQNIEEVKDVLQGSTTVVAGPSGVGKSSLINLLQSGVKMEPERSAGR